MFLLFADTFGLFLLLAGFIIGLGAVTVIDVMGFLGRKSSYWTETTLRAHHVTKPLIWIGMTLTLFGGWLHYRAVGVPEAAMWHAVIAALLLVNGAHLSFEVSPKLIKLEKSSRAKKQLPAPLQKDILRSFVISFVGWWGALVILVWHIM